MILTNLEVSSKVRPRSERQRPGLTQVEMSHGLGEEEAEEMREPRRRVTNKLMTGYEKVGL